MGLGLVFGFGLWQGIGLVRVGFRVRVRLGLELGLCSWPNAQHVWSNTPIDQMRLTSEFAPPNECESKY